jgi:adenylate kinase
MMVGITGTPGTGKSSVAAILAGRGHHILHLSDTVGSYILEEDLTRDTRIVDVDRWASEFPVFDGIVEGHIAHLLPCDRVVVLRCRPDVLRARLDQRGYAEAKIRENCEAEILDVILIETLEIHPPEHICEIDTTNVSPGEVAEKIEGFMRGDVPSTHGTIDWMDFLGLNEYA